MSPGVPARELRLRGALFGASAKDSGRGELMVRFARVVAPGIPHHVTQRGNARRFILEGEAECRVYLDLLRQGMERYGVELIGYCLMSNHVHLIAVPTKKDGLARSLKNAHRRFASYWNAVNRSSGHVWQGLSPRRKAPVGSFALRRAQPRSGPRL